VLYSFKGGTDGANPNGGFAIGDDGAIYGTTFYGGAGLDHAGASPCRVLSLGCGTVFRLTRPLLAARQWNEEVLYKFQGYPDGNGPAGNLVRDGEGNIFGTTIGGGPQEDGTIFEMLPPIRPSDKWTTKVVLSFGSNVRSQQPMAGLVRRNGNLYGTAYAGGDYAAGVVFRLTPPTVADSSWGFTMLCDFPVGYQAEEPESLLMFDQEGALYGTTVAYDTHVSGTVFRIGP
jgi:uncharacterized repeat protein (TIGR03803 family)